MDIYKFLYLIIYLTLISSMIWSVLLLIEKIMGISINYGIKLLSFLFAIFPFYSNKVQIIDPEVIWIREYKNICIIWSIGVCLSSIIYLILSIHQIYCISKMNKCSNIRIINIYKKCQYDLNYLKPILLDSQSVLIAAATGIFRKYVICNVNKINVYSDEEIYCILYHELLHHKQKHMVYVKLVKFIGIIYWFNPIYILMKKNFLLSCEFECDNKIVKYMGLNEIANYMELLIKLSCKETKQYCQMTSQVSKRIMNLSKKKYKLVNTIALGLLSLGILLIVSQSLRYSEKYFYPYPGLMGAIERAD